MEHRSELFLYATRQFVSTLLLGHGRDTFCRHVTLGEHQVELSNPSPLPEVGDWQAIPVEQLARTGVLDATRVELSMWSSAGVFPLPTGELTVKLRLFYWWRNEREQHVYLLRQNMPPPPEPRLPELRAVQRLGRDFRFVGEQMEIDRSMVLVPAQNEPIPLSLLVLGALGWVTEESLDTTVRA